MIQGGQAGDVRDNIGRKTVPLQWVDFVEMLGGSPGGLQVQLVSQQDCEASGEGPRRGGG